MKLPLRVAVLTTELTPIAKAGGLGDVVGSLPKELRTLGVELRVFLPKTKGIDPQQWGFERSLREVVIPLLSSRSVKVSVWRGHIPDSDVNVYLVDIPPYFNNPAIYSQNVPGRSATLPYIVFSRAVMELLKGMDWQPDVMHINDWFEAITIKWLKTIYLNDPFWFPVSSVLTIHNLSFQGKMRWSGLPSLGLGRHDFWVERELGRFKGINILATGIEAADAVNTVSITYARQIRLKRYGAGLDRLIRNKKGKIFGILNGIDYSIFDPHVEQGENYVPYDREHLEKKAINKSRLQRKFGLPEDEHAPLICIVSRLSSQKGFDLVDDIIDELMDLGIQLIVLGEGSDRVEKIFVRAKKEHPGQVANHLNFDADLAQYVYAGSDMLLMPSRFEPMGLSQLIAMRFGTIPIVRKTGGLADTVRDGYTGFVFRHYDGNALLWAIRRAVGVYRDQPEFWRTMQLRGMKKDFSWKSSAKKYLQLYRRAIKNHHEWMKQHTGESE